MIVLKENACLKVIVYDEGQLLAHRAGNTLPGDRSYSNLSGISIQMTTKEKEKPTAALMS